MSVEEGSFHDDDDDVYHTPPPSPPLDDVFIPTQAGMMMHDGGDAHKDQEGQHSNEADNNSRMVAAAIAD